MLSRKIFCRNSSSYNIDITRQWLKRYDELYTLLAQDGTMSKMRESPKPKTITIDAIKAVQALRTLQQEERPIKIAKPKSQRRATKESAPV